MWIRKDIENVKQSENSTCDLLKLWSGERVATVEKLIEFLREDDMDRDDIATILEDWLETKISNEWGIVHWNCIVVVELGGNVLIVFQFFFDTPVL